MFAQKKRPQHTPPSPQKVEAPRTRAPRPYKGPLPRLFVSDLEKPAGPRQHKPCPACVTQGETCTECAELEAVSDEQQFQRTEPTTPKDAAERQADDYGARMAEDLRPHSVAPGPLGHAIRTVAERHLGMDLAGTTLRADSAAHDKTQRERAVAITEGSTVSFRQGSLTLGTESGRALLGHELTHVAQQRAAGPSAQRKPEDTCEAPPKEGVCEEPKGPSVAFEGWTLHDDKTDLLRILSSLIVDKDDADAAKDFVSRFDAVYGGGGGAEGASAVGGGETGAQISLTLDDALRTLNTRHSSFLSGFQTHAEQILRGILKESETRIKAEALKYGVETTEVSKGNDSGAGGAGGASGDGSGGGEGQGPAPEVETETQTTMKPTVSSEGLAGAAKELLEKRDEINVIKGKMANVCPSDYYGGGAEGAPAYDPCEGKREEYSGLERDLKKAETELKILRSGLEQRYPILGAFGEGNEGGLGTISKGPSDDAAKVLSAEINERLANIETVRGAIGGGVNIWKLRKILAATLADEGIQAGTEKAIVVRDHASDIASDEALTSLALTVLSVGLSILAAATAVPTGGASLVAAGAMGASLGIGFAQLLKDVEDYQLESAAANTDFDKARAISAEEPSLFWLALSIVGVVFDVADAISVFGKLSGKVTKVLATTTVDEFESALETLKAEARASKGGEALAEGVSDVVRKIHGGEGKTAEEVLTGVGAHESRAVKEAAENLSKLEALAEASAAGHTVKVTPGGVLVLCSTCTWFGEAYAAEIAGSEELSRRAAGIENKARNAALNGDKKAAEAAAQEGAALADELALLRREAGKRFQISAAGDALSAANAESIIGNFPRKLSDAEKEAIRKAANTEGGIWNLEPQLRGEVGHVLLGENLPRAFPTIDVAKQSGAIADEIRSIKTHQPYAFQEPGSLWSTLREEVDAVSGFTQEAHGGRHVKTGPNTTRILEVGIPPETVSAAKLKSARSELTELQSRTLADTTRMAELEDQIRLIEQWRREMAGARAYGQGLKPPVTVMFKSVK
ncbi:MAG: DUF4157 domain-containing protein [Myxococcales bacterium]|nr:DUF4157 domain-containing protein [Myxococcales bacterium]MCB9580282.1 DUF4157 domain-containing protein [Polyangiaceae bacterium]